MPQTGSAKPNFLTKHQSWVCWGPAVTAVYILPGSRDYTGAKGPLPVIPALGRLRQVDCNFEPSRGHKARLSKLKQRYVEFGELIRDVTPVETPALRCFPQYLRMEDTIAMLGSASTGRRRLRMAQRLGCSLSCGSSFTNPVITLHSARESGRLQVSSKDKVSDVTLQLPSRLLSGR